MSYTKTTWVTGDTITAAKLNKMEGGIEAASGGSLANVKDGTGTGAVEEGLIGDDIPAASRNTASGAFAHVEGGVFYETEGEGTEYYPNVASGESSHAEGSGTTASGTSSHAEGGETTASGFASHAEGYGTVAQGIFQSAIGTYNTAQGNPYEPSSTDYAFIIGNGTDESNRSNALAVRWDGAIVLANGTVLTVAQLAKVANLT